MNFNSEIIVDKNNIKENEIINAYNIKILLPSKAIEFYKHGWQSWSLTCWINVNRKQYYPPCPSIMNSVFMDPKYQNDKCPNGSWLGAVKCEDGQFFFLGGLNLNSRVRLSSLKVLEGIYDDDDNDDNNNNWFLNCSESENELFEKYTNHIKKYLNIKDKINRNYNIWCSWYNFYDNINQDIILSSLVYLKDYNFDIFQIDDGWQVKTGDWEPNGKFKNGMKYISESINKSNMIAGLWIAPLIAVESSELFINHKELFLRRSPNGEFVNAGFNWGEPLYALDVTHPSTIIWLNNLILKLKLWNFKYIKLDFLYAGALPGYRYNQYISRELAYRKCLYSIQMILGSDGYIDACGAPILPSLGICDALRIGPDVSKSWENKSTRFLRNFASPCIKNAVRTTLNRYWLNSIIQVDPDVIYFHSIYNNLLINIALLCNFNSTSDLPYNLSEEERNIFIAFLNNNIDNLNIKQIDHSTFIINNNKIDLSLPKYPKLYHRVILFFINRICNIRFIFKFMNRIQYSLSH